MNAALIEAQFVANQHRPLRVAIVHASDLGGGAERSVISLHRGLRALGHASTVFVGEKRTEEDGIIQIPYVRGIPGLRRAARAAERTFGWQDIYNPSFRALSNLVADSYDVIHFNSLWGSAGYADIGALPTLTRRVPGVITMRENWLITGHCACFHDCMRWRSGCGSCPNLALAPAIPRDGTRRNWQRKQRALRDAHVTVVTISDWLKGIAEASPMLADKPVTRIYNGIDLATFARVDEPSRLRLRSELGFASDEVVVLLAGQTVEGIKEGIATHHAITALNALAARPRLRAFVIGHSAARVGKALRVPVTTLPFQSTPEQMSRCFLAADVTLVTSEVEAFGRIAAESQACATPVVAFGSGGIPEVVRDQVGGLVVPRGDGTALVTALARMIDDVPFRARCAEAGWRHVRNQFDQTSVASQYAALYRDVIARFGPGHG